MQVIWDKRKPTTIKNLQANALLECIHQVLALMFFATEIWYGQIQLPPMMLMPF